MNTPENDVVTEIADAATVTPAAADLTLCRDCRAELGWRDALYARGTGQCKRCKQRSERRTLRGVWRPSVVIHNPKGGRDVTRPTTGPNRAQRRRQSA